MRRLDKSYVIYTVPLPGLNSVLTDYESLCCWNCNSGKFCSYTVRTRATLLSSSFWIYKITTTSVQRRFSKQASLCTVTNTKSHKGQQGRNKKTSTGERSAKGRQSRKGDYWGKKQWFKIYKRSKAEVDEWEVKSPFKLLKPQLDFIQSVCTTVC